MARSDAARKLAEQLAANDWPGVAPETIIDAAIREAELDVLELVRKTLLEMEPWATESLEFLFWLNEQMPERPPTDSYSLNRW